MTKPRYLPGHVFGDYTLVERLGRVGANYRGLFECRCGAIDDKPIHNMAAGYGVTCTHDRRAGFGPCYVDNPTINTAHNRHRRVRGRAVLLPCAVCGRVTKGNQWAYRHAAPDERSQVTGKDRGQVFSALPDEYWVLCRRDHARFDRAYERHSFDGLQSLPHIALRLAYDPDYESLSGDPQG